MPRISVVVPIFDVEPYLPDCLRSLAAQTFRDLEVVMVDDGSTDAGAEIAARFVERDPRFRLVAQANHGLGHARNTGVAAATGELLAFADSDDVVPCRAYERLAEALDRSGSDFASGNVLRLEAGGTRQAPFLAETFARTRVRTHVRRFRPLLADRTAWNKLFRRAFWDAHGLRFPEGVLHEDIPVTLPAHVMARSVDVLAEPVYHWRIRRDGDRSITQKRLELRTLVDRLAAVAHVRAYLSAHGTRRLCRAYDKRLVRDDLRLHLDLLADADPGYRTLFLNHVHAMLDEARPSLFAALPAIDRLKWHLALRGRTDELLEVLRFARDRRDATPPLRRGRRWYGDYPFRGDRELAVPRSVYRLGRRDAELSLRAAVEELAADGERLIVRGHAHLAGLDVAAPGDQRVELLALRPGRLRRVELRAGSVRAVARPVERPDLERRWSGFEAALPTASLSGPATWQLGLYVRTHGLRRRYLRFDHEALPAAELPATPGLAARAVACTSGRIEVRVRDRWAAVRSARLVHGDVLEVSGELRAVAATALEVRRASDGWCTQAPLAGAFSARFPLTELRQAPRDEGEPVWELAALDGTRRVPLSLPGASPALRWWSSGRELALGRTRAGDVAITDRDARPVIVAAGCSGGLIELELALSAGLAERELVLMDWHRDRAHAFPLADRNGTFRAAIPAIELLRVPAGLTPRRSEWRFYGRPIGQDAPTAMARVRLDEALELPLGLAVDDRPSTLMAGPDGSLLLSVPERTAAPARGHGARAWERRGASARARAE